MTHRPLRLPEALGMFPIAERLKQARVTLQGEDDVPPSRFGLSSFRMLRPRLALPLWLGKAPIPRRVVLTNLFNHRQTPASEGWSVLRTQVEDFRGRDLTYDSHNGTDLCIPIGTPVLSPAPGRVVRVVNEFNRGGLKIFVDHGDGLMTCCAHLGRALVTEGDVLSRAQPMALSGYSGIDGLTTFPWGVPHVHFNTWLNGEPVDPFPRGDEVSLWKEDSPRAHVGECSEVQRDSAYDEERVNAAIASCKTAHVRHTLRAIDSLGARAARVIIEMNYYPTRFPKRVSVYAKEHARSPRLDLPFPAALFDGVT
ncbi:MAG: M23 family metallopeptidase, partial [Polyangiales bacterium]